MPYHTKYNQVWSMCLTVKHNIWKLWYLSLQWYKSSTTDAASIWYMQPIKPAISFNSRQGTSKVDTKELEGQSNCQGLNWDIQLWLLAPRQPNIVMILPIRQQSVFRKCLTHCPLGVVAVICSLSMHIKRFPSIPSGVFWMTCKNVSPEHQT